MPPKDRLLLRPGLELREPVAARGSGEASLERPQAGIGGRVGGDPARLFDSVPLAALGADSFDLAVRPADQPWPDLALSAYNFGHGYSAKKVEERRMGPTLFVKNHKLAGNGKPNS